MSSRTVALSPDLYARLHHEATALQKTPEQHIVDILEGSLAPQENSELRYREQGLRALQQEIQHLPSVSSVATSSYQEAYWWVKFHIDIHHHLAWHVVQELGHVLNYLSLHDRLPTVFRPVSPPPYLNGGPETYLDWVIEAQLPFTDAGYIAEVLRGHLPQPSTDEHAWREDTPENE